MPANTGTPHDALSATVRIVSRRSIIIAVILLAGCLSAAFIGLSQLKQLREDGAAINISGRQRALAMSLELYADRVRAAQTAGEQVSALANLSRVHQQLQAGQAFLTSDEVPVQIATYYENLWRKGGILDLYVSEVIAYANGTDDRAIPVQQAYAVLDQGVNLYEHSYHGEWENLHTVLIMVGAALVIMVICVYTFMLLPMQAAVRREAERMALFVNAVEQSGLMVVVTDPQGVIRYANQCAVDETGYSLDELIGQHTRMFGAGQTPKHVFQSLWNTIRRGNVWKGEFLNKRKSGELFWIQATISPIRDKKGEIEGYLSIKQDITLFKQALQENEKVRDQLLTAIEAIDDAFALFDKDERMVLWNSRCQTLFQGVQDLIRPGVTFHELISQGVARGQYGDLENPEDFISKRMDDFRQARGGVEVQLANGTWLMGADRKTVDGGRVVVRVDITQLKETEDALRDAKLQADTANQAKSAFLSSMSHELRTPMNAILGFAQMMQIIPQEPLGKQQSRCVDHILKGGQHLLELINEVLDLAKIEAGKIEVSIEPLCLAEVFRETSSLVEKSAQDRGISLSVDVPDDSVMVRADLTRCKQVILNLLSNAVKYNRPNGNIQMSAAMQPNGFIRVNVQDTGFGIPADKQKDVFKPFNRLGAETSDVEGTGIGLSITKQLVRLMGGRIGFSSVEGEGSCFYVDLLHDVRSDTTQKDIPAVPNADQDNATTLQWYAGTVLCVEDNPANMSLLEMALGNLGDVSVVPATSAEDGLDLVLRQTPDLILMDINLPGMDGFAALSALKANPQTASIPVVAMTANAANGMVARGLQAGFDKVMIKPVVVPDLIAVVTSFLEVKTDETGSFRSAEL